MKEITRKLYALVLFSLFISSSVIAFIDIEKFNAEDINNINLLHICNPQSQNDLIQILERDNPTVRDFGDNFEVSTEEEYELRSPQFQKLRVFEKPEFDKEQGIKLTLTDPTQDWFYRGATVIIEGELKSLAPGDYWDGETVYVFYNVTQSQYEGNMLFYDGNPQYAVGSDVTDSSGIFTVNLDTSDLTTNPFSRVGDINLLTYFKGNPGLGRGAGSPGAKNVTFYGQLKIDVVADVTNPSASYSFTTEILFDNDTVVTTDTTQYNLDVSWSIAGSHFSGNRTFGVSNQDIYTNTAPATVQTVTYIAQYNTVPLSLGFFTEEGDSNPTTLDTLLYKTISTDTEQQAVVDAYFVVASVKTKVTQEIALDSYFTIYANLSDHNGLQASKTIQISYIISGGSTTIEYRTTDGSGEIQFTKQLPYGNVSDITSQTFTIQFTALASEFPGATITPDSLDTTLAVNITSIIVIIADKTIFYTNGESIDYGIYIQDEFGRAAGAADFNLDFPGIGTQLRTTTATGIRNITTTIPSYTIAQQTQFKTITVTAQNVTGAGYRYVVTGTVDDTDNFDMYFALTLTLLDPNLNDVTVLPTWTEFNSTFVSDIQSTPYNLSAVDQWGRDPLGATIYIDFDGLGITQYDVSASQNWVTFTYSDLLGTGLDLDDAHTGLIVYASGGNYAPASSVQQTVNIYGPDNDAPAIAGETRTPDPDFPGAHDPYYNITFTFTVTDVGTGIRSVQFYYRVFDYDDVAQVYPVAGWDYFNLYNAGGTTYKGTLNVTIGAAKLWIHYYINATDYAGHGLDSVGNKQTVPALYYDADFGWSTFLYSPSSPNKYRVGDFVAPVEEAVPTTVNSPDPINNPYVNITVYVNDSLVYSEMGGVVIFVNRTHSITDVTEVDYIVAFMYNLPGTNQWFYQLMMGYSYTYTWYYVAFDNSTPSPPYNMYISTIYTNSAIDDEGPTVSGLTVDFNGSIAVPDSVINFTATITDVITGVDQAWLNFTFLGDSYTVAMTHLGGDTYFVSIDLSDYWDEESGYGTFSFVYWIESTDVAGNKATDTSASVSVVNESPTGPGGFTGNIGAIIGGVVGGIVALIAVLFLWINRHTLQNYAKKQTFRRRLRDYLRELIEDIKKDGLEGRYKEGLLKTWSVVEGIGREFFDLPRYRSQTPREFSRLLARRGKIESQLMYTLLEYFTKARYGYEEITENDFNSGVRALLKIVDKIEVGEMKIES
ncbi:MAG: DUF4129 domain-containing protein [Candidatus Thorarchaeota archaeon]